MQALSTVQLLDLGERARLAGVASRSALIIQEACPELSRARVFALRLSASDRILAAIRAATFGPLLAAQQNCSACGEAFEISFDLERAGLLAQIDEVLDAALGDPVALTLGDLAAVERERDPAAIKRRLAERLDSGEGDIEQVSERLEQADPDADIVLETDCPSCGEAQRLMVDIGAYLWEEIAAQAPRILRDVADLARAYHWSERDILAMSGPRRAFYLGMIQ
jgi:hypothetical protein